MSGWSKDKLDADTFAEVFSGKIISEAKREQDGEGLRNLDNSVPQSHDEGNPIMQGKTIDGSRKFAEGENS